MRAAKSADIYARLVELLGRLMRGAAPLPFMPRWVPRRPAAFAAAAAARLARSLSVHAPGKMPQLWPAHVHAGSCRDDASAAPFIAHPTRALRPRTSTATSSYRACRSLDMIVVPLVAFDQTGARLGYGGGATTATCPCSRPHAKSSASPLTSSVSTAFPPTPTTCRYPTSSLAPLSAATYHAA
ncbi:MAG: 5-formyltetrahydrofolate cyclo-ligase [Collinsella sp.]